MTWCKPRLKFVKQIIREEKNKHILKYNSFKNFPQLYLKGQLVGSWLVINHISHHMLTYTARTMCKPLRKLFTFSLRLAVFPDNWNTALVLPLFKNGEKQ
jgi:hypothetical protein